MSDMWENGSEAEFFASGVAKHETLGNNRRAYIVSKRGKNQRLEFTMVMSREDMAEMGRALLRIAAEQPGELVDLEAFEPHGWHASN